MREISTDPAVVTLDDLRRLHQSRRALTEEFRQLRDVYDRVMAMRAADEAGPS